MKTNHSSARPPHWAEMLLRMLLEPRDRERVSGDLLDPYRETIVPAVRPAADYSYVRQVGWFLLRASWGWGAVLGAALVFRYLFDMFAPAADYSIRATMLTYTIIGACMFAGFGGAWRTHSIRGGVVISFSAATIAALLSIAGTAVMFAIWHDPTTRDAWRSSGGLDEAFIDVPVKLVALGIVIGAVGAVLGRGAAESRRRW